jgi:hypothetical protein
MLFDVDLKTFGTDENIHMEKQHSTEYGYQ